MPIKTGNFISRALNRLNVLKHLNVVSDYQLNGQHFKIPILDQIGYPNLHISEKWMIEILDLLSKNEQGKFIDIGVNIGQTLIKLKSVNSEMEYIGFEPNPVCVNYVEQLIQYNEFKDTTIIPIGIGGGSELMKLNFYHENTTDSSASIIADFRPDEKIAYSKYVPLFTIEKIAESIDLNNTSIVKIDVEGAELEVIKGIQSLLSKENPFVLMEILPTYKSDNDFRIERQNALLDIFRSENYKTLRIIKQGNQFTKLQLLNDIEIHGDLDLCDYLFAPEEKMSFLKEVFPLD